MQKIFIIVISIFFSVGVFSENIISQSNNSVYIEYGDTGELELEYWKNPGRYSPMNAFDGKLNTCIAENNSFYFYIRFDKQIKIDAIKIAAGYFGNKRYYKFNNRIKKISIDFFDDVDSESKYPFFEEGKKLGEENFELKDRMEYQLLKFKKVYNARMIEFIKKSIYKGSKYDDICISDVKFYYKGKEIKIINIDKSKREYIKYRGDRLKFLLNGKTLYNCWNRVNKEAKFIFKSNGIFEVAFTGKKSIFSEGNEVKFKSDKMIDYLQKVKRWKIKQGKLLFFVENKWELVKYSLNENYLRIYKIGKRSMLDNEKEPFSIVNAYDACRPDGPNGE